MGKTSSLSIIHPLHPHKKSLGFSPGHGQTVTNSGAGPPELKSQYQPTCCPGKASDERHHSSRDVCTQLRWQLPTHCSKLGTAWPGEGWKPKIHTGIPQTLQWALFSPERQCYYSVLIPQCQTGAKQ